MSETSRVLAVIAGVLWISNGIFGAICYRDMLKDAGDIPPERWLANLIFMILSPIVALCIVVAFGVLGTGRVLQWWFKPPPIV